jgi:hypothetical protein
MYVRMASRWVETCKICKWMKVKIGMVSLCLTPLSTTFQLYRGGQFFWCKKLDDPGKPLTCRKSLTNIMLYTSSWSRFALTTSVVIGTDCTDSCKSNYHTITATIPTRIMVKSNFSQLISKFYISTIVGRNVPKPRRAMIVTGRSE